MFCKVCGKELKDSEKKCSRCGEIIKNSIVEKEKEKKIKQKWSPLYFFIISLYFTTTAILSFFNNELVIEDVDTKYIISFYFGTILIPLVLSIIGFLISKKEKKNNNNKINIINFYLNLSLIIINIFVFALMVIKTL